MPSGTPNTLPATYNVARALHVRHSAQERSQREHPQDDFTAPFLTFNDHRRYRTISDWMYEAGIYPRDMLVGDDPAWYIYSVVALKFDPAFMEAMCVVDWGPKFDLYRYQWLPMSEIESDHCREDIFKNIIDEETLARYAGQEFWASSGAEKRIRAAFKQPQA